MINLLLDGVGTYSVRDCLRSLQANTLFEMLRFPEYQYGFAKHRDPNIEVINLIAGKIIPNNRLYTVRLKLLVAFWK